MNIGGLRISRRIMIPAAELEYTAIRAQGPGGQHVNKVSSAVQLRFDVKSTSALPDHCKERLLRLRDHRVTEQGTIVIRAQRHRSQLMNKTEAANRLRGLIQQALAKSKPRKKTRPTARSVQRRLDQKRRRSALKLSRRVPDE